MRESCLKDWSGEEGHYDDPLREEKAKALTNGILALSICDTLGNLLRGDFFEVQEDVLTKEERKYLINFIRVYRDKIVLLEKDVCNYGEKEAIYIKLKNEKGEDCIRTPSFEKGTRFKKVVRGKEYSLKDLGI